MPVSAQPTSDDTGQLASGHEMVHWIEELFPVCRSITGNGVRETLKRIQGWVPLEVREVPSGTKVFDWTVPREWNIRDAFVKDWSGRRVVDFRRSNLHVVSYSIPVHRKMSLAQLKEHLHTLPDRPDWIPYRTSYYKDDWGFCLKHSDLLALSEGEYEVKIDSVLEPGHLTYGELVLPGDLQDEVLISCHVCHPSLANDNLSGIAVAVAVARVLRSAARRYTYRFLFVPGTIGAITWLALNEANTHRVRHGLVLAGLGDRAPLTYKKSRQGNAQIDRAVKVALRKAAPGSQVREFSPYGYDERQYCSPGFDLPVGRLSRAPHGEFPEYHTSADDLAFIHPDSLAGSLAVCQEAISILEHNWTYESLSPKCEPQLGKRGLYRALGGTPDPGRRESAMLWVLNQSDGANNLLDIAERSGVEFELLRGAAQDLEAAGLLRKCKTSKPAAAGSNGERMAK